MAWCLTVTESNHQTSTPEIVWLGGQGSLRMSEPSSQDNPVFNLTTVHVVARCIHVIADAGVADALDEERDRPLSSPRRLA